MSTLIWRSLPFFSGPAEEVAVRAAVVDVPAEAAEPLSAEAAAAVPVAPGAAVVGARAERAAAADAALAAPEAAAERAAVEVRPREALPEIRIEIRSIPSHA